MREKPQPLEQLLAYLSIFSCLVQAYSTLWELTFIVSHGSLGVYLARKGYNCFKYTAIKANRNGAMYVHV